MTGLKDRIQAIEEKLKKLKEQERAREAKKRAAQQKLERTRDTRKKILVGALVLAKVFHGEWPQSQLKELLEQGLTRPEDRALFGLAPLLEPSNDSPTVPPKKQTPVPKAP